MGVADPPPFDLNGPLLFSVLFFIFYFLFCLNEVILGIKTCIWGNFENCVPKNALVVQVSHFLSKNMEMANRVLTLKNS
jgi:hypothetical protein